MSLGFLVEIPAVNSLVQGRTVLEIPVPKVLAWSGAVDNPVGSEYMLVEEARGTRLRVVWGDMEFTNVVKVIEDITTIQSKFSSVEFTWYGYSSLVQTGIIANGGIDTVICISRATRSRGVRKQLWLGLYHNG